MGRPKKIRNGMIKAFRFSEDLVQKLELTAKWRQIDVSDLVREMLEKLMDEEMAKARDLHLQRLKHTVEAGKADPTIEALTRELVRGLGGLRNFSTESDIFRQAFEAASAELELRRENQKPAKPEKRKKGCTNPAAHQETRDLAR